MRYAAKIGEIHMVSSEPITPEVRELSVAWMRDHGLRDMIASGHIEFVTDPQPSISRTHQDDPETAKD